MKQFAYMETSTISTISGIGLLKGTYSIQKHTRTSSELTLRESKVESKNLESILLRRFTLDRAAMVFWLGNIKADVWFSHEHTSLLNACRDPRALKETSRAALTWSVQCLGVIFRGLLKPGLLAVNSYQLNVSRNVNMKPWSNCKNGQVWVDSCFGMIAYNSRCEIRLK